jgi:hypothetical protein
MPSEQSASPDLSFLKSLLDQPEREPRSTKKLDVRDYDTWFKLEHRVSEGYCSNPECAGQHLINKFTGKPRGRGQITSIVNDHEMCRFCFLDKWHYKPPTP